ncbi:MAG: T9SS type A sorting domain-containing protein [Bacteroidia bacterium]|nr:T9SS type A sorting domain-containing protein [Bacteroidia bacterium]
MALGQQLQGRLALNNRLIRIIVAGAVLLAGIIGVLNTLVTQISGTVNRYTAVTAVGSNFVNVASVTGFAAGDRVLLIQMKGSSISQADDTTYGTLTDLGNSGVYELCNIASVSNGSKKITFTRPVCKSYTISGLVQLVRVPVYTDVEIKGTLTGQAWNGSTGGIIAVEASGTMTMKAHIDASGIGFRGGSFNGSATTGGLTYICDVNSGKGGIKGEGIAELPFAGCRGKMANGGGGGNDHNGGGGGGGNWGTGGIGGHGWLSNTPGQLSDTDKGGRGGQSLRALYESVVPRLFLGGGGGGGHQNNGASYEASNGGGIVILIANTLTVSGSRAIRAYAPDAEDITINDGAGGGGAGGAVLLDIQSYTNPQNLTIDVSGGDGGTVTTADQHGPGGGGAGGYVNTTGTLPGTVNVIKAGGLAGKFISTNSSHPHHNTTHGAANGQDGAVISNLVIQICSAPPTLDLNGAQAGTDRQESYSQFYEARSFILPADVQIQDTDDTEMEAATVTIINPEDGSLEQLEMMLDASSLASMGIQAQREASGHVMHLLGEATIEQYRQVLAAVAYKNASPAPTFSPRLIQVTVDDGGNQSNTAFVTLNLDGSNFPVEWVYFDVQPSGSDAALTWATASELNSDYFEVERSGDGRNFEARGRVEAAGVSNEILAYQFRDAGAARAASGSLFYRLRQVDVDGQFAYSSTVELMLSPENAGGLTLRVFPNPATEEARIRLSGIEQAVAIQVLNVSGQTVWNGQIEPGQELAVPVGGWNPGVYIFQTASGVRRVFKKVVVR